MESKATGYSSSEKEERERCHGTQPVKERESYSSSRYYAQYIYTYVNLSAQECNSNDLIRFVCLYRDSCSQELAGNESEDSESKPTKLVSVVTQVTLPNVWPENGRIIIQKHLLHVKRSYFRLSFCL